jgi:hypothetical protein
MKEHEPGARPELPTLGSPPLPPPLPPPADGLLPATLEAPPSSVLLPPPSLGGASGVSSSGVPPWLVASSPVAGLPPSLLAPAAAFFVGGSALSLQPTAAPAEAQATTHDKSKEESLKNRGSAEIDIAHKHTCLPPAPSHVRGFGRARANAVRLRPPRNGERRRRCGSGSRMRERLLLADKDLMLSFENA